MGLLMFFAKTAPLFPIIVGMLRRRNLLWWLAVCSILSDLAATVVRRHVEAGGQLISNIYCIVEFALITFYFRNKIFRSQLLFFVVLLLPPGMYLFITTWHGEWYGFNGFSLSLFQCIYIIYGICGFYVILKEQRSLYLERLPFFWGNLAIFFYASITFFICLLGDRLLIFSPQEFTKLWVTVMLSVNIVTCVFLGISLSKESKN